MKRAQNGAECSDRELLRRLERRVMKESSFQIKSGRDGRGGMRSSTFQDTPDYMVSSADHVPADS